jgi:hypothetical protein
MSPLRLSSPIIAALTAEIGRWGRRGAETGGFLLAPESDPDRLSIVALADQAGIARRRGLFVVSGPAIEQLFSWAGDAELRIRAQVHSHARGAFLSPTDLRHGFDVTGFISAVVPNFAAPSPHPGDWGWWQRAATRWEACAAPEVITGQGAAVRFDQDSVRAA